MLSPPMRNPSSYTNELKLEVTLEALREQITQRELSTKYDIPQPLISIWKKNAIASIQASIEHGNKRGPKRKEPSGALAKTLKSTELGRIRRLSRQLKSVAATLEEEVK